MSKKIAPMTSAATDKGQSPKDNVIITRNCKESNQQTTKKFEKEVLHTITMEELYDIAFPPKMPIVEEMIYNGTYVHIFLLVLLKWENHFLWNS